MKRHVTFLFALAVTPLFLKAQVCLTPDPANGYAIGNNRGAVKAARMDADAQTDLVVTNFNDASVSILRRNGTLPNGHPDFSETTYPVGNKPFCLYVHDLDNDGDNDIAITNYHDGTVSVLINNGNMTMTRTDYTVAQGVNPLGITGGFFNADNHIDLVVTNSQDRTIRMLYGTGNGNFTVAPQAISTGSYTPAHIVAGEFDGVAGLDVAIACIDNSGRSAYIFFKGNGQGQLQIGAQGLITNASLFGGVSPTLDTADFNNDGLTDVVFNFPMQNGQKLFFMQGHATVGVFPNAPFSLPLATSLQSFNIACADFNGDGNTDVAAILGGYITDSVKVLLGDGNLGFPSMKAFRAHDYNNPRSIAAVDFNNDGKPDLVTANETYSSPNLQYDLYSWLNQTLYFTVSGTRDTCGTSPLSVKLTAGSDAALTYTWSAFNNPSNNGNSFVMSTSGEVNVFSVTANDGFGCTNTSYGVIHVHPLPLVDITGPQNVCAGNAVTLTATGANTYAWEPATIQNGQPFTPETTALYTVKGYSGYGCMGSDTITVFVNPLPSVQVAVDGETITATYSPANAQLQWRDCDSNTPVLGATQGSFIPAQDGRYAVVATAHGCASTSDCVEVDASHVAVKEWETGKFSLYPNPSNGGFTLSQEQPGQAIETVRIMDMHGREVQRIAGEKKTALYLQLDLAAGVYFVEVNDGQRQYLRKIIIQ